jgi:AcrR family transcriptional regulator
LVPAGTNVSKCMVPGGTVSRGAIVPTRPKPEPDVPALTLRSRILDAAFSAFTEEGYAATSTLEIATRAKVSKRDLYTLVGTKHELLIACITDRAGRLRASLGLPEVRDRESLEHTLIAFAERQLRVVSDPNAIAMFRLAIAEAERAPEIAHALESIAREAGRASLLEIVNGAIGRSLLAGDPLEMVETFTALLFGNVLVTWLLHVAEPPGARDMKQRAQRVTSAFLKLYL